MDIVNRLNFYMEAHGIGSTQFADNCGIPRPTLSQILSGRNKKISDAVIAKIHNAYPRLSVLWLLFGEGQMELSANDALSSTHNNTARITSHTAQETAFSPSEMSIRDQSIESDAGLFGPASVREPLIFDDDEPIHELSAEDERPPSDEPVVTIPADGSKSIVNIMVFYSDNSYQSFVPR